MKPCANNPCIDCSNVFQCPWILFHEEVKGWEVSPSHLYKDGKLITSCPRFKMDWGINEIQKKEIQRMFFQNVAIDKIPKVLNLSRARFRRWLVESEEAEELLKNNFRFIHWKRSQMLPKKVSAKSRSRYFSKESRVSIG